MQLSKSISSEPKEEGRPSRYPYSIRRRRGDFGRKMRIFLGEGTRRKGLGVRGRWGRGGVGELGERGREGLEGRLGGGAGVAMGGEALARFAPHGRRRQSHLSR